MVNFSKKYYLKCLFFLILFSLIPLIAVFIEFLSLDQYNKTILQFDRLNPQWWEFFTSSFVHSDYNHFFNNIEAFLVIIILTLGIAILLKKFCLYLKYSSLLGYSFAFVSSIIYWQIYPIFYGGGHSCGLSGIIAVFLGSLPVLLVLYISSYPQNMKFERGDHYYSVCLFEILLVFQFLFFYLWEGYLELSGVMLPVILLIFSTLLIVFYKINYFKEIMTAITQLCQKFPFGLIIVGSSLLLYFFYIFMFFPSNIITESGKTDIIMHYLGLLYGLNMSYFIFIYFDFFRFPELEKNTSEISELK